MNCAYCDADLGDCGNWVTCIIGDRAHRYPRREVKEIVEDVSHGRE